MSPSPGTTRLRALLARAAPYANKHVLIAITLLGLLILVLEPSAPANQETSTANPALQVAELQTAAVTEVSGVTQDDTPLSGTETGEALSEAQIAEPKEIAEPREPAASPALDGAVPRLAIILDDIGNNLELGLQAVNLPGPVTLAILPFTPHAHGLAEAGHQAGKEIMLHAPMSNLAGSDPGPGALTAQQDQTSLIAALRSAIADIPHLKGINNHTGSELTAVTQSMQWVMEELKLHDLYFVDSMTSAQSVAATVAKSNGIPVLKRHVFLDNVAEESAIDAQMQRALGIAEQSGLAVAIGHPYPATLAYLEERLPQLQALGSVQLVLVSTLLDSSRL
ncbi:divergent polysaccharide deacetylase family protein [Pseudohongiella sp. O18]|uniref:divergent polysaccharide deacetylase family protein n=1 Tax=Pseudohongiella sp. O18 TaxID=2904248 RepID=UPI001F40F43A|nr:divergent polysaccharide deacetylase family protein [Pseudohongiella sp. O18]